MSNSIKSYIKKITEAQKHLEDIEEMSTTASVPGYQTPNAFSGKTAKDDEKEESNAEASTGYKMVKKKPKKIFVGKMGESIYKKTMNELTYNDYKSDPSSTPKAKVNTAIKEINRKLFEIERIVKQNNKLKTEMGVSSDNYWKSSKTRIGKIGERILRIGRQLKELAG
jgi:hypothetical protein|tara:strand:- start:501 stop:1004 length:504 start_codon:yes stop_codon:yes gene_type:complete